MPRLQKRSNVSESIPNWGSFIESSVGGYEIYKFISEVVVHDPFIRADTAASLRVVNKDFRRHIDAALPLEMKKVNEHVHPLYKAYETRHRLLKAQDSVMPPAAFEENKQSLQECNRDIERKVDYLMSKFGSNTTDKLCKCFSMHIPDTFNLRASNLGWIPNIEHDRARFSVSAHSFLMLASKNACELNLGACQCRCKNANGHFTFVPNGAGLLMRCSEACMNEKCIDFNPDSSQPITVSSYDRLNKQLSLRESNFVSNVLTANGIHHPFSRSCFEARIGQDAFNSKIKMVQRRMNSLNMKNANKIKMMLLDTVSSLNDRHPQDTSFKVMTLQNLIGVTQAQIATATSFVEHADRIVLELEWETKVRVRGYAMAQTLDVINAFFKYEGMNGITRIEDLEELLPGSCQAIDKIILQHVETCPMDKIYYMNAMEAEFSSKLLNLIACTLGTLKKMNFQHTGVEASKFAYSYVSGVCAGMDSSFTPENSLYKFQTDITKNSSLSSNDGIFFKRLVLSMHLFDHIEPESIKVRASGFKNNTVNGYREMASLFYNAKIMYEAEFKALGMTFYVPFRFNVYDKTRICQRKMEAAAELLASLNYASPVFRSLPKLGVLHNCRKKNNDMLHNIEEQQEILASWLEDTIQKLCSVPEVRIIGLDFMTCDNTSLFVNCVDAYGNKSIEPVFEHIKNAVSSSSLHSQS
jgi:hypothetical protein